MKWKKCFETGINRIDEDHKALVTLINKLEGAMTNGSSQVIGTVLKELVDYVKIHFHNEELIMERIEFPELARHRVLHRELVNEVAGILIDLKNGKLLTTTELIGFLNHWLSDHILGEDIKIGQYLGLA